METIEEGSESDKEDVDEDPISLIEALRDAKFFNLVQSWHSELADGVDARVEVYVVVRVGDDVNAHLSESD